MFCILNNKVCTNAIFYVLWKKKFYNLFYVYLKPVSVSLFNVFSISIKFPCDNKTFDIAHSCWRGRISIFIWGGYLLSTLVLDLKMVRLFPNLIVPPMFPGLCSGMSITCRDQIGWWASVLIKWNTSTAWGGKWEPTTGCLVSGSNSVELASVNETPKWAQLCFHATVLCSLRDF